MANDGGISAETERRELFYARAGKSNAAPLWRVLGDLVPARPKPQSQAACWSYNEVRPFLLEACELIGTEEAERRVLMLENPGVREGTKIVGSLYAGLQIIQPGETARPHRHAAAALRFVIEGTGGWTAVNGERTIMSPGDFVVTPAWTWHEHGNDGDDPVVWMDSLDIHMVNLLDAGFREGHNEMPPLNMKRRETSTSVYGQNLLPMDADAHQITSPIFNYKYSRSRAALRDYSETQEIDRCHGFKLRYANPLNGGWAIPTIATWLQLLPAEFKTRPYRSTDGTVYVVTEGRGQSLIDGKQFNWQKNDIFVVPSWTDVQHIADEETVLFAASDRALQEKFGLWREQPVV